MARAQTIQGIRLDHPSLCKLNVFFLHFLTGYYCGSKFYYLTGQFCKDYLLMLWYLCFDTQYAYNQDDLKVIKVL